MAPTRPSTIPADWEFHENEWGQGYWSPVTARPAPAPAPAPLSTAIGPVGFDWESKGNQTIGGFTYLPQHGSWGGTPGDYSPGIGEVHRYKEGQMGPGQKYDILNPNTGQVIGTGVVPKSSSGGFFGDFFDLAGTLVKEVAPLAATAVSMGGAAPLIGGLSAALGGGAAGTIAANALVQGGLGALQGGDFLESALRSAVTGGVGQAVNPIASSIGADVFNATDSKFLSDIVSGAVKGVPGALMSGDASNLLTGAVTGVVGSQVGDQLGLTSQQSQVATNIASKLLQGGDLSPADLMRIGTSFAPGPAMPGTTGNEITEGFFDEDGPGFMPTEYLDDAEVDRELQSLLGRYPAPQPPSDWFLGENIASGIPEWDMAAVNAGLPIGNLEQDFSVAQTKEGPQIVDSAGNVGNFVNGEFVVDTGVTPNLSYAATSAPAPGPSAAPGKAPAPGPSPSPSPAPRPSVAPTPRSSEAQLTRYDPVLAQVDPYDLDRLFSIGRQGGMTIEDLLKVISGETTRRRS